MILTSNLINDFFNDGRQIGRLSEFILEQKSVAKRSSNENTPFDNIDVDNNKSVVGGIPICMKQTWNQECHTKYKSIDRLSDLITIL